MLHLSALPASGFCCIKIFLLQRQPVWIHSPFAVLQSAVKCKLWTIALHTLLPLVLGFHLSTRYKMCWYSLFFCFLLYLEFRAILVFTEQAVVFVFSQIISCQTNQLL